MNKFNIIEQMYLARFFEEETKNLYAKDKIKGYCHLSLGLESISVALSKNLSNNDVVISSYRCHLHMLACGSNMEDMFAEMLGRKGGVSNAHGGSMHMFDKTNGFYGGHGIVGSQVPLGTGLAFGKKYKDKNGICFTFLGDGAVNQGQVLESFNIASLWRLPIIYIIENNRFSIGTHISESTSNQNLFEYGENFKIKSIQIDALDVDLVIKSFKDAKDYVIKNKKPHLIEIKCKRLDKHSTSHYISKNQEYEIKRDKKNNDCIKYFLSKYFSNKEIERVNSIRNKCLNRVKSCAKNALLREFEKNVKYPLAKSKKNEIIIKKDIFISYRDAISTSIVEEMYKDSKIYLIGEDIGVYGGVYGVTSKAFSIFKENRVKDTPVSEAGFTGLAIGSAYFGLKPIVEFMSFNFVLPAMDQIINSAAKIYSMSGGKINCPIVFRGSNGHMENLGAQHNQCYASWFSHCPGLIVLAPSNSQDAYILMKEAIKNKNPVIFLEHSKLYDRKSYIQKGVYKSKIGKSNIIKEGSDILIISYSYGIELSKQSIELLEKYNISVELIDLVSINPLDIETIKNSANKIGKALVVEEGWGISGIGSEIISRIYDSSDNIIIKSLSSEYSPIPFSSELEKKIKISPKKIATYILNNFHFSRKTGDI